jgi:hypothetical protein
MARQVGGIRDGGTEIETGAVVRRPDREDRRGLDAPADEGPGAEVTSPWHEERELLLKSRISELNLRIEGSEVEPLINQLYGELTLAGLDFKPPIYLTDEWGCPEGMPIIGVPFYLASPKLAQLEREFAENLETPEESMMYLRHEAGHTFNYAYMLYEDEEWHQVFGPYSRPYREAYKPNPFSRDYVHHIAGWYAQKHPDEDLAETFAVWLDPQSNWREVYAGVAAFRKLEYIDRRMKEVGHLPPKVSPTGRDAPVEELTYTVQDYYTNRREPRIEVPRWFDGDLKQLFESRASKKRVEAAPFLRERRSHLVNEVAYWTGVPLGVVRSLVDNMIERVAALNLYMNASRSERYLVSFAAMLTTLTLNYLHHDKFAPDVRPTSLRS